MIDKIEPQYDGNSYTMNFKFVKCSEHGNCFAPTDPCQSHAKLPARHLFSQYVAHSARRALFPMGSIGPLRGPGRGGQGPLGTHGGRRASRLRDCGGGAGQISKNRRTRRWGSIQLYGWITLRMYCFEITYKKTDNNKNHKEEKARTNRYKGSAGRTYQKIPEVPQEI